jgi:hypothetical protein
MKVAVERRIALTAARQHGLISRTQALATGMTRREIDHCMLTGRWRIVQPTIYRIEGSRPTWEQSVMAACLRGGEDTGASHLTAGRLWDCEVPDAGVLEVISTRDRRVRIAGVRAHRSLLLPRLDLTKRTGIPVTTPARTILECSPLIGVRATAHMTDDLVRRKLMRYGDLRSCTARLAGPGRRRLSIVREVLANRLPGYDPGDSNLEVRALDVIARAGLPAPVQQHPVQLPDGRRARIDLAYPDQMVAIEMDGWKWHGQRGAFDRDRARANELVALGWRVVRFTDAMDDSTIVRILSELLRVPTTFGPPS